MMLVLHFNTDLANPLLLMHESVRLESSIFLVGLS